MRAYENQHSDRLPTRRSRADKEKQLALLRQQLSVLTVRAQETTRQALRAKIAELERELAATRS
jgi:hypothetical protein